MSYGNKAVLSGVYFELRKGEITSVVGRNGSGKTTLLKVVLGLLPPSRESFFLEGVYRSKSGRIRDMAYLPAAHREYIDRLLEESGNGK